MTQHPNEYVTAAYLDGGLQGEALESFEAHLAECAGCRAGVALFVVDVDIAAEGLDEADVAAFREAALGQSPPRSGRGGASFWLIAAGLAAGLAAVAALAVYRFGSSDFQPPVAVERNGATSQSGGLFPAAGSIVQADDLGFRFDSVPGAERYIVSVHDSEGNLVATFEVREPAHSVDWPSDSHPPTGTLLWNVRAMAIDRTIEETRPIEFEVRR